MLHKFSTTAKKIETESYILVLDYYSQDYEIDNRMKLFVMIKKDFNPKQKGFLKSQKLTSSNYYKSIMQKTLKIEFKSVYDKHFENNKDFDLDVFLQKLNSLS